VRPSLHSGAFASPSIKTTPSHLRPHNSISKLLHLIIQQPLPCLSALEALAASARPTTSSNRLALEDLGTRIIQAQVCHISLFFRPVIAPRTLSPGLVELALARTPHLHDLPAGFGATNNTGGFGSTPNTTGGGLFGGGGSTGFGSTGGMSLCFSGSFRGPRRLFHSSTVSCPIFTFDLWDSMSPGYLRSPSSCSTLYLDPWILL